MPSGSEVLNLSILSKRQSFWLLVINNAWGDHDSLFIVLGVGPHLRTIAALIFIASNLIEELPVFLWEVGEKAGDLVGADVRVFFIEVEQ